MPTRLLSRRGSSVPVIGMVLPRATPETKAHCWQKARPVTHWGGMQKAIAVVADEADRQSPLLPETKALKAALEKLPSKPPTTNEQFTLDYKNALLGANKAALALDGKLKGVSEEIKACRDGLLLAAQSEWLACWLKNDNSKEALQDARRYAESLTSLFPKYPSGYSVLSEIDQQSGDSQSAVAVLRKGSESCEDNTQPALAAGFLAD